MSSLTTVLVPSLDERIFLYRMGQEGRQTLVPEIWQSIDDKSRLFIGRTRSHAILERTALGDNFEKSVTVEHIAVGDVFECAGVKMAFVKEDSHIKLRAKKSISAKISFIPVILFAVLRKRFLMAVLLAAISWLFHKSILFKEHNNYDAWLKEQMRSLARWEFSDEDDRFPPPIKFEKKKLPEKSVKQKVLSAEELRIQLLERFDPIKAEKEKAKRIKGVQTP